MPGRPLIREAGRVLRAGGVIAYPTEAVFGLGCDPRNREAVIRLLGIKHRSPRHGLILVAAHESQLEDYLAPVPADARERMTASWPGPQTWVVPASPGCPIWIRGEHATVAVRVSAHPVVKALCESADMAIVSTSANRRAHPPARSALACRVRFGRELDLVVGGATGRRKNPTAIRNVISGETIRAS